MLFVWTAVVMLCTCVKTEETSDVRVLILPVLEVSPLLGSLAPVCTFLVENYFKFLPSSPLWPYLRAHWHYVIRTEPKHIRATQVLTALSYSVLGWAPCKQGSCFGTVRNNWAKCERTLNHLFSLMVQLLVSVCQIYYPSFLLSSPAPSSSARANTTCCTLAVIWLCPNLKEPNNESKQCKVHAVWIHSHHHFCFATTLVNYLEPDRKVNHFSSPLFSFQLIIMSPI